MSLIGNLFSNAKIIDSTISGIDKAFLTDEEKADYYIKLLKAYEPFKIVQRMLAFMFGGVYLLTWIACVGLFVYGVISGEGEFIQGSDMLAQRNNDTLGVPVSLIMGLYFGGGMVEGIIRSKTGK